MPITCLLNPFFGFVNCPHMSLWFLLPAEMFLVYSPANDIDISCLVGY